MNNAFWQTSLWQQLGAAIDTLDQAIAACPDDLWQAPLWPDDPPGYAEFWYLAYHVLFWLDFYLSGAVEGFTPPPPFTLTELDPTGFPERVYEKVELQSYLTHCRRKCQSTIETLTDARAQQRCAFSWGEASFGELLLYNMRHVQEHAAQFNLFLGQQRGVGAAWVVKARRP
ncbi:MAG: DinB family protein [Caldilineaceae bacterium]